MRVCLTLYSVFSLRFVHACSYLINFCFNRAHPLPPAEYPLESSASPFGIALSGDHIYWTDFTANSVNRALKVDGSEQLVLLDRVESLSGITLVSKVDLDRKGEASCT